MANSEDVELETWEDEGYLNSPVCSECGVHPEEDEEHDEGCPYGE